MNAKGNTRVVLLALKGRRAYVNNLTHRGSMYDFRELVEWLRGFKSLEGTWTAHGGSVPIVRFDSGGSVSFVSGPYHLDGYDVDQTIEDLFR